MAKPDVPVARRGDYSFDSGTHAEAVEMIRLHHYAKGCANTSTHRMIMRKNGIAVGAALWMPPTAGAAKALAKKHLGSPDRHREVIVLSRLVVVDGEPQNAAGMLLGTSTREVIDAGRWSLLVTYADEAQAHKGTIYRATGWAFDGRTAPQAVWHVDGQQVSRLATKSRTVADMLALGAARSSSSKLRFIKKTDAARAAERTGT